MKKRPLASSDDDADIEFQSLLVSNYHLEDDDDEPVCFSVLPMQWSDSKTFDNANNNNNNKGSIFLHGLADNGLRKFFMQVIAWRFDLSGLKPEVSLLSKDRRWIKLQKPRKSFQDTVRTVLITIYFLHSVKKNPRISATTIWNNLCKDKDLSSYGFKPSQKDLLDHMPLIGEAAKRNAVLARSKLLLKVLGEKPGNQKPSDEEVEDLPHPGVKADDIDDDNTDEANEDPNVSVCAFCDNGGNLLCCDGGCTRSFHATKEDGREATCVSLGLTQKEVDEIQNFYCKNCEYHQHQCFVCGKLGSSNKVKGAEVFKCAYETCDNFYHPQCVAKLLPRVVEHVAEELEKNIADGDPFTCPVHYCRVCKGLENKMEPELQFAVCRRCPKSYHRKCLPREIAVDSPSDEDIIPRAWEGLLPNNRILVYCLNHEIVGELGTPIRDHIKFPNTNTTNKRMKPATEMRVPAKGSKVPGKLSSTKVGSKKSPENMISGSDISKKRKSNEISSCLTENKKSISKKFEMPSCEKNKQSTGEELCALLTKGFERIKHDDPVDDVGNKTLLVEPIRNVLPPSDADSERRNDEIGDELGTPIRDHMKLPDTRATIQEVDTTNKRMKPATKKRVILKNSVGFDNSSGKSTAKGSKVPGKLSPTKVGSKKSSEKMISGSDTSRELKSNEKPRSYLTENKKSISQKVEIPNCEKNKQPTGEKLCALTNKGSERIKHDDPVDDVVNEPLLVNPIRSLLPPSDADPERRSHPDRTTRHKVTALAHGHCKSKTSQKKKCIKENDRRGLGVASLAKRQAVNGVLDRVPDHSQPNLVNKRSSFEACARVEVDHDDHENLEPTSDFGRSYCGIEKEPSAANPLSDCQVSNIEEHNSRGEEKHSRESDIRQQVDLSGVQNPNSTESDHLSGHAQLIPVTESSYKTNTLAVERYAPPGDKLNHVRMSSLGPEPPIFSRSGAFERSARPPGFASCLNLEYSRKHSAGWISD